MWSGETRPECFRYRVLGLPRGKLDAVSRIRRNAALFLYDFHAKYLYGPYRAKTVRALLAGLDEDDRRVGLRRTPKRVAKAFRDDTRDAEAAVLPPYSRGRCKHLTPASSTSAVQQDVALATHVF
ncbi:uncharacterized protein [Triticum aestivum]|uniref:uncharacterized protein n=1 Tax=Triticum aestivum TaxID=4565 RepID=UPI001D01CED4|nr:uncharacterized protein LOC123038825 [Triticum aestivum]